MYHKYINGIIINRVHCCVRFLILSNSSSFHLSSDTSFAQSGMELSGKLICVISDMICENHNKSFN